MRDAGPSPAPVAKNRRTSLRSYYFYAAAQLSPRENEIIQRLAHGHLYKEIADRLGLSVETVRTHIRNIYQKLHVHGRTAAINKVFGQPKAI
jgi:DNA-binding CsgD family transcriptional regulator